MAGKPETGRGVTRINADRKLKSLLLASGFDANSFCPVLIRVSPRESAAN